MKENILFFPIFYIYSLRSKIRDQEMYLSTKNSITSKYLDIIVILQEY